MMRAAVSSYIYTKWVSRSRSRLSFERWQNQRLTNWLAQNVPSVDYYAAYKAPRIEDLPVIDKAVLMANFAQLNTASLTTERIWSQLQTSDTIGELTVGASTGTSGNRGLFVISEQERFSWLGAILAKAIPNLLTATHRIAVILPRDTRLYSSANKMSKIKLSFFDVGTPNEQLVEAVEKFNPSIVVAPPKIWTFFSTNRVRIYPKRLFSASETLDPIDKDLVESTFKKRLDQIYMATEGLLAVSCSHGSLHLAEDSTFFEFREAGDDLYTPLISTFARTTQILARYQLNDLLRLSNRTCTCGSPLKLIEEIVGRNDDVFQLQRIDGNTEQVTPDVLRNVIVNADSRISDFRLVQTESNRVHLTLPNGSQGSISSTAVSDLNTLFKKRRVSAKIEVKFADFALETDKKLRRVQCQLRKGKDIAERIE